MLNDSLFSVPWVNRLIAAWNNLSQNHPKLAGAGAVEFQVTDPESTRSVILHWDENGCLKRLSHYDGAAPSFRAAEREWGAFISGEYSAVAGVMAGRIEYKGKMSFALRYGASFDTVAEVARNAQ